MNNNNHSVYIVLLPMEGGVGLDDDVFVRVLFEFVDEHGLAGLQGFGDFGVHADGEVWAFVIGGAHLPRFRLHFVAQPGRGLNHTRAPAVRLRRSSMSMKSTTMMPPRSRRRIWRTISLTASRLVLTMVSSRRVEPLPTNLPVLTSMATSASVWLMTM